jgi:hypothetical protein
MRSLCPLCLCGEWIASAFRPMDKPRAVAYNLVQTKYEIWYTNLRLVLRMSARRWRCARLSDYGRR